MTNPPMTVIMLVRAMQLSEQVTAPSRLYFSRTSILVALIVAVATTCQQLVGAT